MNESLLQEREKGYEKRFKDKQETSFRAGSHAAKQLGLWAAEQLNLKGEGADAYAAGLLDIFITESHHQAIVAKVFGDFQAKGVNISRRRILVVFEAELEEARELIQQNG